MGSVNWAQLATDAGDVGPIPIGKYSAIVTKAELKKSSSSDREYWQAVFRIQEGPQSGKTLYNNFVLVEDNPNALRAFFINMQNLGITQEQLIALGSDKNALTPLLVGRQAVLTVTHREYQGQMRDNVDRIDKHPAGPVGNLASAGAAPSAASAPIPTAAPVPVAAPPAAAEVAPPAPAPAPVPEVAVAAAPAVEATVVAPPAPPAPPATPF